MFERAAKPESRLAPPVTTSSVAPEAGGRLDPTTMTAMEAGFGFDFSRVRVHADHDSTGRAAALGVPAYTEGQVIGFAPGWYAPETDAGRHILAHELAHVVQQATGLAGAVAQGDRAALEADAEHGARLVLAGRRLPAADRIGPAASMVQRFDPPYHEEALTSGLSGIFAPAEIGQIEEANWRRDFSQAPVEVVDMVLTWKQLKAQYEATGKTDRSLQLRLLVTVKVLKDNLIAHVITKGLGGLESYGGYRYWEHMDKPDAQGVADAQARWASSGPEGTDIPAYIRDSRASVKDLLARGINTARLSLGTGGLGSRGVLYEAWSGGAPPREYGARKPLAVDPGPSTAVVGAEAERKTKGMPGAAQSLTPGFNADPSVADDLGRASHLIEDFFAHSNFVELTARVTKGQQVFPGELKTGSFDLPDELHSLAGKLSVVAAEVEGNKRFVPFVADLVVNELREASRRLEAMSAKQGAKQPGWRMDSHTAIAKDSPSAPGFQTATQLAARADAQIFWMVRTIMEEPAADVAEQKIRRLYELVDQILTAPSANHPLKDVWAPLGDFEVPQGGSRPT
jgi:hypothetical protein